jgi:hypothetical protein
MMEFLPAAGTTILLLLACTGAGVTVLRASGVLTTMTMGSAIAWGFPLGLGALGWIVFFSALSDLTAPGVLVPLALLASTGMIYLRRAAPPDQSAKPLDLIGWLLCSALTFILFIDLLEGLSPAADADTLAYHFTLPKWHLDAGTLQFIPRALDGAPPQLIHMSYLAALGLGGERALTLWTMASGWMTGWVLFSVARDALSRNQALALAVIYLSTPAVLQTGGSGHIEPLLAQFALVAALATGLAIQKNSLGLAAIAGLSAGFFAGSKYTGLLMIAACGLAMLLGKGRWRRATAFGTAATLAGAQWYVWNWSQTGDPVFPLLFNLLGATPGVWDATQDALFRDWLTRIESPLPRTIAWFIAYPFYATFANVAALESGRTGLGLFPIIALPFAAAWLLTGWQRQWRKPLPLMAVILLVFYTLWFFGGSPQRVRHLLPVLPLILLVVAVPAFRWAKSTGRQKSLAAAITFCLLVQIGAQAIFGLNYARHVWTNETRSEFLARNVPASRFVDWINENLKPRDKVLTFERELLFLFDVPVLYEHKYLRVSPNFSRMENRPDALFATLRDEGVTHILSRGGPVDRPEDDRPARPAIRSMLKAGCLSPQHRMAFERIGSRTLRGAVAPKHWMMLYRLQGNTCPGVLKENSNK